MARSLFSKARVAVLGNLHALLDQVANTPEAYEQLIRDLDNAISDAYTARDAAQGDVTVQVDAIAAKEADILKTQASIDLLITDDDEANDVHAVNYQLRNNKTQEEIQVLQGIKADSVKLRDDLTQAVGLLEQRRDEMVSNLQKLRLQEAAGRAKNNAARAVEDASGAAAAAAEGGFDSIVAKVQRDKAVADARFSRVVGGMQASVSAEEAANLSAAKSALAARRAEIAAKAAQA